MRFAVISDIHSNLEALTAVLQDIETREVDEILCLGDIVGYGPNPNECIELVKNKCSSVIIGNHDFACIDQSELEYFNIFASQAILWTVDNLSESSNEFLSKLSLRAKLDDFEIVHANPENPKNWDYILSIDEAIFNFSYFDSQICFHGHSHAPIIFIETTDKNYFYLRENHIQIKDDERYLINVGSVGQPRDSNPASAYGILDTEQKKYQLVRVPYNFRETQEKMKKRQLPNFLIERLANGR